MYLQGILDKHIADRNEVRLPIIPVANASCWPHNARYKMVTCPGHGTILNIPDDLSALKESISNLNASSRNFEDNSFSVELFVDK
jgi:hypothetical protein